MFRYLIGASDDHGFLHPVFQLDSAERLDRDTIWKRMVAAVEQAGFTRPAEGSGLEVEEKQAYSFRGQEIQLPLGWDDSGSLGGIDLALTQVQPHEVLVIASRIAHSDGSSYDHRLLAAPKGSRLPRESRWYHRGVFQREVNAMSNLDSNSDCQVDLPAGARIWESGEWRPISHLLYRY